MMSHRRGSGRRRSPSDAGMLVTDDTLRQSLQSELARSRDLEVALKSARVELEAERAHSKQLQARLDATRQQASSMVRTLGMPSKLSK